MRIRLGDITDVEMRWVRADFKPAKLQYRKLKVDFITPESMRQSWTDWEDVKISKVEEWEWGDD